jgi:hypothetical protein
VNQRRNISLMSKAAALAQLSCEGFKGHAASGRSFRTSRVFGAETGL